MVRTLDRMATVAIDGLVIVPRLRPPALRAFVLQSHLEHPNLPLQLLIRLLAVTTFSLEFCNLCLHLGAFNVPGVSRSLVVVPFYLQEAHHTWSDLNVSDL